MHYQSNRNFGCRIYEYVHRGMRHVQLENSALSIIILLDKGADIIEIRHKKTDIDFLWRAPLQLTEFPKIIPTNPGVLGNNLDY